MLKKNPYQELEKRIGYRFRRRRLLEGALTHRSFRYEVPGIAEDNQRLEFLGDAVLGFLSGAHLYRAYDNEDEGRLTSFRSQITSGRALAECARELDIGQYMKIGLGEDASGGRVRAKNLADALEALLGAVYLDGGIPAATRVFKKLFIPRLARLEIDMWAGNPKGKLQEYAQRRLKRSPTYAVIRREGPPHETVFTVEVRLEDGTKGRGTGPNKQAAEVKAAAAVLDKIHRRGE